MSTPSNDNRNLVETDKQVPLIWTALRILGVYFLICGVAATIEDGAEAIRRWRIDLYTPQEGMLLNYLHPRFWGSLIYVAAGAYLLMGGHWIVKNVFIPHRQVEPDGNTNENDSD